MEKNTLIAQFKEKKVDKIKFAFTDTDGILRGKVIHIQKFLEGLDAGYGFCDVVFGWDSSDTLYDRAGFTGWQTGFPDKPCYIDLSTMREIPWQNNIPFFLADFSGDGTHAAGAAVCPRSLLKKVVAECAAMGYHPEFAQEFEWFNFRETPSSLNEKQFTKLQPLTPGMYGYSILRTSQHSDFYDALFNGLAAFQVPLEGLHTETGPGAYEAALLHDHALAAADKAVLFKNAVKEIAAGFGLTASFMAKWNSTLPGCSGHLHQSLWNPERSQNLFFDAAAEAQISTLMKHYIAGQLHCLPELLPMYAPTINSYKRLVEGTWAPTTRSWGFENRTAALRVINPDAARTRLETRVPGSDSNPYLAMAAALASGLYGIRHKLSLDQTPSRGNAYADPSATRLPGNLYEAALAMKNSTLANALFGNEFVTHFTETRLWEVREFNKAVTDWELKRYFEII